MVSAWIRIRPGWLRGGSLGSEMVFGFLLCLRRIWHEREHARPGRLRFLRVTEPLLGKRQSAPGEMIVVAKG